MCYVENVALSTNPKPAKSTGWMTKAFRAQTSPSVAVRLICGHTNVAPLLCSLYLHIILPQLPLIITFITCLAVNSQGSFCGCTSTVRQLRAPASHVCTYHRSQNCPPPCPPAVWGRTGKERRPSYFMWKENTCAHSGRSSVISTQSPAVWDCCCPVSEWLYWLGGLEPIQT